MSIKIFITGTDTGIGKTYISVGLINAFKKMGYVTMGVKPISSGGFRIGNHLFNQDALELIQASSIQLDYKYINPFVFEPAIAPHIAASQKNISLSLCEVVSKLQYILNYSCDIQIIEGVGGWEVPLNENETMVDFVIYYQMPIIFVVGIRLGCINHALLTYQAIKQTNLPILGWIANCVEKNVLAYSEIITTLQKRLDIIYLGQIPYCGKPENFILIDELLQNSGIAR